MYFYIYTPLIVYWAKIYTQPLNFFGLIQYNYFVEFTVFVFPFGNVCYSVIKITMLIVVNRYIYVFIMYSFILYYFYILFLYILSNVFVSLLHSTLQDNFSRLCALCFGTTKNAFRVIFYCLDPTQPDSKMFLRYFSNFRRAA